MLILLTSGSKCELMEPLQRKGKMGEAKIHIMLHFNLNNVQYSLEEYLLFVF